MAKKANGEGTFTDLPSGKVRYQIYIDGKRKSFTGKNKTDCRNQYKTFLRNYDLRPLDSEIRLKAWMERYLTSCRKDSMLPSSYHQLELLRDKIPEDLMHRKVSDIRPVELQKFLNDFSKTASESYIQKMSSLLRSTFAEAQENDLCIKNPARKLRTPHKEEKKIETYSANEVRQIILFAESYEKDTENRALNRAARQIAAAVVTLLLTGIRRGELLGLEAEDLDRLNGIIHIRRAVYELNGVPDVKDGKAKTPGSIRDVPAPNIVFDFIDRIPNAGKYIFGTSIGTLMYPRNFNRAYESFMRQIPGVRTLPVHACRHTYATLMQSSGVNIRYVQLILGHTKIETTARYSHPDQKKLKEASALYTETVAHALHTDRSET